MDLTPAAEGETRFSRKKNQPGGGPSGGSPSDREVPRPPLAPPHQIHAGRGAAGAGRFCACDAGGRGLNGFMMDPTAARWPGSRSSPFRMRKDGGSPAAAPPDGKFPMRPKRVRRARRSMGSGAGGGRPADQMEGRGGVCDRPDAIVRGSGCPCACGARVTHAICKRCLRYISTQLFYCSHIPMQNMPMQILRRP